jgi:hypothetical protein
MSKSLSKNAEQELALYRWQVFGRVLIAVFGGYFFALAVGILLTQILPLPRSSLVMSSILASFALYATAIIWVFSVKRFRTLLIGVGATLVLLALALFLV